MATKTNSRVQLIDEKLNELKSTIAITKTSDSISKNTRSTKLYALGRDRRILHLIRTLMEANPDVKLDTADSDTFVLITTLASERTVQSSVEVHEGDSILDLLQKYADKKGINGKLNKACEKAGLKLDYSTGKVVKA